MQSHYPFQGSQPQTAVFADVQPFDFVPLRKHVLVYQDVTHLAALVNEQSFARACIQRLLLVRQEAIYRSIYQYRLYSLQVISRFVQMQQPHIRPYPYLTLCHLGNSIYPFQVFGFPLYQIMLQTNAVETFQRHIGTKPHIARPVLIASVDDQIGQPVGHRQAAETI